MTHTKRILQRMEEQMIKQHETQLNQMFQMQENNEHLEREMNGFREENTLLREYLADLENELAEKNTSSKPPMPRSPHRLHQQRSDTAMKRNSTRKTIMG